MRPPPKYVMMTRNTKMVRTHAFGSILTVYWVLDEQKQEYYQAFHTTQRRLSYSQWSRQMDKVKPSIKLAPKHPIKISVKNMQARFQRPRNMDHIQEIGEEWFNSEAGKYLTELL